MSKNIYIYFLELIYFFNIIQYFCGSNNTKKKLYKQFQKEKKASNLRQP